MFEPTSCLWKGVGKLKIHVCTTKEEINSVALQNATAIVIDVLLATTTLVTMMENGANHVYIADTVSEAKWITSLLKDKEIVTGGESEGLTIPGFTCGPLPEEFSPEQVRGKDVVYVSTNGTRAIRRAESAKELLLANLRNARAVVQYLQKSKPEELYLLCSGAFNRLCLEDFLCAGIIIERLDALGAQLNDAAKLARHTANVASIYDFVAESNVGTWLVEHGFEQTLQFITEEGASHAVVAVRNRGLELL